MAEVLAINVSDKKGVIKLPVEKAEFVENFGIKGDAHGGPWHRQISLLADESVDKMRMSGLKLGSGVFAENITTKGIELHTLPVGTRLKIGETIQEVSQIGKECHHGCAIKQQVGHCIMPTEGIFTKVIKGGIIQKGDPIEIIDTKV